ncbi:MAG: PLP-dependent aminotransferase family protein [Burkholderiaceae bacterium]
MTLPFAQRLQNVETSAIRALFKLLGQPGMISFAGGFPDANLCDRAGLQAAAHAAYEQHAQAALAYGATEGYPPLREAIAQLMQSRLAAVQADDVLVTTGSQQALDLIGKTLIDPGDKVIVEGPTFLATIQCFRLYGADLVSAPTDEHGVDVSALEQLVAQHRPKLIYLIPTFGNPTGATLSAERRQAVLQLAARTGTLVVEDDPYGELYFDAPPPPSLLSLSEQVPGSRELLVHCGSLSKTLSAGLRLGWMVAPAALRAQAVMCKQFSDANTSTLAQATATAYLQSGALPQALAHVRAAYRERAHAMLHGLQQHLGPHATYNQPQGGLFVWARFTAPGADSAVLSQRAAEQGVAFVPGAPFYASNPDPATFRLSFATVPPAQIDQGLQRLAAMLAKNEK